MNLESHKLKTTSVLKLILIKVVVHKTFNRISMMLIQNSEIQYHLLVIHLS